MVRDLEKEDPAVDIEKTSDELGFEGDPGLDFEDEDLLIDDEDEIIPSVLHKGITKPKTEDDWRALLLEANEEGVPEYQISATYQEGDLVKHTLFGLGVVSKIITPHKMEMIFETSKKLMAMGVTPPSDGASDQ